MLHPFPFLLILFEDILIHRSNHNKNPLIFQPHLPLSINHFSPWLDCTVIAKARLIFYRFYLHHLVGGPANDLGSKERGRYDHQRQKIQCLDECPFSMCKSCGKKCIKGIYPFKSLTDLNSSLHDVLKKIIISSS